MKFTIITNNPSVLKKFGDLYSIEYKDVGFDDVLALARDRIHAGYQLLSHPLSGSVKPHETPYKSIMLCMEKGKMDETSLQIIENCIAHAKKFPVKYKTLSEKIDGDFQLIDLCLITSAIQAAATVF